MSLTKFLNTDLQIESSAKLSALIQSIAEPYDIIRDQKFEGVRYLTVNTFVEDVETPNSTIAGLLDFLLSLPKAALLELKNSNSIELNMGFEAGSEPKMFESSIEASTIEKVSKLEFQLKIGVTIYSGLELGQSCKT